MKNIIGLSKKEIAETLVSIGEKPFRAEQIWNWIYVRGVKNFSEMSNIAKETREILAQNFTLLRPAIDKDLTALDGTRKWLLKFADGNQIEAVFIPEESRGTLCISSQVGCTLSCKFCHTGTQTLVRNLEAEEIIMQIMIAKDFLDDWKKIGVGDIAANGAKQKVTNIVFMGMGEPFYNYENVAKATKILNDSAGLNLSARKITISTSGIIPEILRMSKELKTGLAISLHATNDELRTSIMAINKKYPLADLMKSCKIYNDENPSQNITFEYVILKDVNDRDEHARELAALIKKYKLNAKINLIPFNPWMSCGFERSSNNRIMAFQRILKEAGLIAPIRKTRGDDVMAACGQLKSESQRESKANRLKKDVLAASAE